MPKNLSRQLRTIYLPALLILAACGQKGPLYLDNTAPAAQQATAETSVTTATPKDHKTTTTEEQR